MSPQVSPQPEIRPFLSQIPTILRKKWEAALLPSLIPSERRFKPVLSLLKSFSAHLPVLGAASP